MSAWPCSQKLRKPLISPTRIPASRIRMTASQEGRPRPMRNNRPTLAAPMTKGIERSRPPSSATSVWPTQASPKNEANSSIDLMFSAETKPSTLSDPTTKSATSTVRPMKALLFSTTNLVITAVRISSAARTTNEIALRSEKNPSLVIEAAPNASKSSARPISTARFRRQMPRRWLGLSGATGLPSASYSAAATTALFRPPV